MEHPNGYYEANNYYPETPNTRKRPNEYIPEDQSKRNATQYYQNGYQNFYHEQHGYYNMNTSNNQYEPLNNQVPMENSWYPAPTQYHDYSQRLTPPINHSVAPDYTNLQTPVTYANGNNSVSNSLIYTPESDTSSNQSEYFGAPMTAAQYHQHMQHLEMQKRRVHADPVIPQVQVVAPFHPVKELLKKLPVEELELIRDNRKFEEEIRKPQSYYHEPMPEDNLVLDMVDGRLPVVLDSTKFDLTVEELRRRLAAPELINRSSLFSFFRKSKRKDGSSEIQNMLSRCNLSVKPGQRHPPETKFTFLLEKEAVRLAQNFDFMYREICPVELLAWKLLEEYTLEGNSFESCHSIAQHACAILERMLSMLRDTQPKVAGFQEKYRKTKFDAKIAKLSLITHGFLHPHSITNFLTLQKVFSRTAELSDRILKGEIGMRVIEELADDEKPFEVMSDFLFEHWKKENTSANEPEEQEKYEWNEDPSLTNFSSDSAEEIAEKSAREIMEELDEEGLSIFEDIEEPLLKCIELLTEHNSAFQKADSELYALLRGHGGWKAEISTSADKQICCDGVDLLDDNDDNIIILIEKENDVPISEDTHPQQNDDDFLVSVDNMDFNEEQEEEEEKEEEEDDDVDDDDDEDEDEESVMGSEDSFYDFDDDFFPIFDFVYDWKLDFDFESMFYDYYESDGEDSDNETPDDNTIVREVSDDDTSDEEASDDEPSDDELSDGEDDEVPEDNDCHSYSDNHTALSNGEVPINTLSSHVEVQEAEEVLPPVEEPLTSFVAPSADELRGMSYEDLSMLPVPQGETSEYWHDKALMAHFDNT